MKKTKINHAIEYFSLALVLSYFYIHNIFLVIIGIITSLCLININIINQIILSVNKNVVKKNLEIDYNVNKKGIKTNPTKLKSSKEDTNLTLVEKIEELGFIPSLEKNDESNVA